MRRSGLHASLVLALTVVCLAAARPARADGFYPKDGDRVVFCGDSITAQREYTALSRNAR